MISKKPKLYGFQLIDVDATRSSIKSFFFRCYNEKEKAKPAICKVVAATEKQAIKEARQKFKRLFANNQEKLL